MTDTSPADKLRQPVGKLRKLAAEISEHSGFAEYADQLWALAADIEQAEPCGHTIDGLDGATLTCDLSAGHRGHHSKTFPSEISEDGDYRPSFTTEWWEAEPEADTAEPCGHTNDTRYGHALVCELAASHRGRHSQTLSSEITAATGNVLIHTAEWRADDTDVLEWWVDDADVLHILHRPHESKPEAEHDG
jgi:hypothetical protein